MVMLVATLALVAAGNHTNEPVCLANEPDGLLLLQSGLALVQPLRSRVISLLQTAESDAHPQGAGESGSTTFDPANHQGAEPPRGMGAPAVVGDRVDMTGGSAVTIVMPPKASREEVALAQATQTSAQSQDESKVGGHGNTDEEAPKQQDDQKDQAKPLNGDGISIENNEDHEDASSGASDKVLKIGDADEVDNGEPAINGKYAPDIIDFPSDKCQKPCKNGICHDGECFCRYPYVGLQCEHLAISEVGKVLAATILTGVALFTALCVIVVFRANQKHSAAVPIQEPHMADEEWLPPPPMDRS
jgi:hypothetical protein